MTDPALISTSTHARTVQHDFFSFRLHHGTLVIQITQKPHLEQIQSMANRVLTVFVRNGVLLFPEVKLREGSQGAEKTTRYLPYLV